MRYRSSLALFLALTIPLHSQMSRYVWERPVVVNVSSAADAYRTELESLVVEMMNTGNQAVDGGHLQPAYYRVGIIQGFLLYGQPMEVIGFLSDVYPLLPSAAVRENLRTYLQSYITRYNPFTRRFIHGDSEWGMKDLSQAGNRREYYPMAPIVHNIWPPPTIHVDSLYALWQYADATGNWSYLQSNMSSIQSIYNSYTAPATRYGQIVGLIGMARIAHRLGNTTLAADAEAKAVAAMNASNYNTWLSSAMMGQRANTMPNHDWCYPLFHTWRGDSTVVLYYAPEVGRFIRENQLSAAQNSLGFRIGLDWAQHAQGTYPGWFVWRGDYCYGEYLYKNVPGWEQNYQGGENAYNAPDFAWTFFTLRAHVLGDTSDVLAKMVGKATCIGDLCHMHKLGTLIRAYGTTVWQDVRSTASVNVPPSVNLTSPPNNSTWTAPAIVNLTASASDPDGSVTRVEFWTGATLLNADTASPYAYSWAGVAAGSYALRAIAYDNQNATSTSTVVNITVYSSGTPVNQPPTVSLTSPVTGSSYTAPANITFAATASDSDGSVTAVRFYSGTTLLNLDTTSPYTYTWMGVSSGTYQLYATATDNQGAVSTSAVANVTVYPPNQPPAVSLTSPVNNSTWTAPATIQLTATATDSDGSIANVRFYRGSTLLNTDSASPYEYTWTNVSSGTYQLRAVAQDNQGATSTSTIITVTVLSSSTPAVWYSLTATANPANGGTVTPASGTYLAGSQIQVTATPNANYTFATWSGDATGTNPTVTLTMDSDKSITANFTYVPPANSSPVVHITSPNDGATFAAPASITIAATATDSDGSIAAVRFYAGTTLLATDSTSPYSYTWTGVPAGSYILTVQAQDNQGAVGTSTAIGITVSAQAVYYTLTVNANPSNGGTITQSPTGSSHLAGTPVTVTATPSAGYEFAGWSGDITGSSTTNPMTVVMDADKVLTANFRQLQSQQPSLTPGEVRVIGSVEGYINATQNPNVVIRFRRTTAGVVTVKVYDLRGRLVMEKTKDGQAGIDDDIAWNAAELPAGVYIARVKGGGLERSKRVVVVK
jgi:uncharacterized repeat protein (TIGR02543 family)